MPIDGYAEYKRREFCKDVQCPIQLQLEQKEEGTDDYEKTRAICKNNCVFTTHQFHRWLIDKGYLIVRPEKKEEKG